MDFKVIPAPSFYYPRGLFSRTMGVGFGFDPHSNEYKVIRIAELHEDDEDWGYKFHSVNVEIYNLSANSWREIDAVVPCVWFFPCSELLFNGHFHWWADDEDHGGESMLSFHISTEVFQQIRLPDVCAFPDGNERAFLVLNESIALLLFNPSEQTSFDIWLMTEYGIAESWTKQFTIGPLVQIERPVLFWKHELLMENANGQLVSYDLRSQRLKEFQLYGAQKSLRAVAYTTSSSSSSPSGSSTENNLESDSESRSSQVGTSTYRSQVGTSTPQTSTLFRHRDALREIKDEAEDKFDEETWFAADEKRNKMTKESIVELLKEYPLPPPFSARVPALQEPANYGTNLETSVYEGQIRSGYRVPMHPFAVAFFNHYKMAPSQLVPNGWRKLVGLIYLVQTSGYPVTVDDFMRLYLEVCFIKSVAKGDGWYYIHNQIRVIKGGPKSNKGWHSRYFFIQRPSGKWEFPR
ncbi:hypothetical protein RJ639_041704 [Escallonia herrerae]|uniref:F-box protein n=1 Tax=Escallonia herrerae TaxID=1293975 RepID=A0AA88WGB1_9ASTE|nr:hypothetical protein RJ639_041704 [Escallonia herrerae]